MNKVKRPTTRKEVFFISTEDLDGQTLIPRVPKNLLTERGYEDNVTKRVYLSTSIMGCLAAMSANILGRVYNVYKVTASVYKPTTEEVPDCEITDEVWSLEPVKLNYVYSIKVVGSQDKEYKYRTKDFEATMYKWDYKKLGERGLLIGNNKTRK